MHNGKYKSIQSMMNRLYRNPMIKNVSDSDMAQYIGDAIKLIEAPMAYMDYVEPIRIRNHRGELPCNLLYIKQTKKYVSPYTIKLYDEVGSEEFRNYIAKDANYQKFTTEPMTYATDSFHTAHHLDNSPDLVKKTGFYNHTYSVQGGYIFTNFSEGVAVMSFKGLMIDEEGYPMIPDNIKVEKAIENYTKLQIYQIEWELGKISDKVMNELKQETAWYMGASNTSLQMQNLDQAEAFKAAFTRTLLKPMHHDDGFRNMGTQEYIRQGSI